MCKALKGEAIVNYCEPLITQIEYFENKAKASLRAKC
jgi:hypothetical protein